MGKFSKGDVVHLKSGGPDMTALRIIGEEKGNAQIEKADELLLSVGWENGDVICEWFEGGERKNGHFKESSLE